MRKYNEKSRDKIGSSLAKKYLEVTVGLKLKIG